MHILRTLQQPYDDMMILVIMNSYINTNINIIFGLVFIEYCKNIENSILTLLPLLSLRRYVSCNYQIFPSFAGMPLYISGESYAGFYIPW